MMDYLNGKLFNPIKRYLLLRWVLPVLTDQYNRLDRLCNDDNKYKEYYRAQLDAIYDLSIYLNMSTELWNAVHLRR